MDARTQQRNEVAAKNWTAFVEADRRANEVAADVSSTAAERAYWQAKTVQAASWVRS